MATSTNSKQKDSEDSVEELECAVCLQSCIHPVKLPCSHIFCFLCVKGIANQSSRCAMCRTEIPSDFIDNPTLVQIEVKTNSSEEYQWFYEGRNGWWQYDERTSIELEVAYTSKQKSCDVLVAGFLYTIDFELMLQQRRNDPSRRRRIKRDFSSVPKKGVAGLKQIATTNYSRTQTVCESDAQAPPPPTEVQCPEESNTLEESDIETLARDLSETLRLIDDSSDQEGDVEEYNLPENTDDL